MKKQPVFIRFLTPAILILFFIGCTTVTPTHSGLPAASQTATPALIPSSTGFAFFTVTPTPKTVSPPPGSGTIAFLSNRDGMIELYAMHADGSDQTNITHTPYNDYNPLWSPDGTQILFESFLNGQLDISLLKLADGRITSLAHTDAEEFAPVWSPDGTKIAFQSHPDKPADIYVMDADGRGMTNLTMQPMTSETSPAWSPDGTRIAFVTNRNFHYDVYTMNADGSNLINLTQSQDDANYPVWSPDATKIAFVSMDDQGRSELHVMNADGSHDLVLAPDVYYDARVAWSPAGTKIAYTSLTDGASEIYVVGMDGSNLTNLTQHIAEDNSPAWSPDGTRIAFASNRDGNFEVYIMNADGSGVMNLTRDPADEFTPVWSPVPQNSEIQFHCTTNWSRLKVDTYAAVVEKNNIPNRVRSGPSLADEFITQVYAGTPLKIIDGPICADGLVFWKVEHPSIPGESGWTAEGDGKEYWLEPYTP